MTLWKDNAKEIAGFIAEKDIDTFKEWLVVRRSMVICGAEWVNLEYPLVYAHGYKECYANPTELHQAYHLCHLHTPVEKRSHVVEIGAGYGALATVVLNTGFSGSYTIFDIPEVIRIQKHVLKGKPVTWAKSSVEIQPNTVAMSFWSISEIPVRLRRRYIKMIQQADEYLIAFQEEFEGIDNKAYFKENLGGEIASMPHIHGSYYMRGGKE